MLVKPSFCLASGGLGAGVFRGLRGWSIERLTGTVLSSSLQFDEVSGQYSGVRAGIRQTRVLEFQRARVCFLVAELNFSSLNSCIFILND
jgi:hypothetical protein